MCFSPLGMMRVVAVWALLLSLSPAAAATLESLSLERLSQESTAVVRARPTSVAVDRRGPLAYTVYSLEVLEAWKGERGGLELSLPGGDGLAFSGVPTLDPGKDYVLFLWTGPSGRTQLTGLAQGLFEVQDAEDGPRAVRGMEIESLIAPGGRAAEPVAAEWRLDELRGAVAAALARKQEATPQ